MDGETERRFGNIIQYGEICEVQPEKGLCRMKLSETRVSPLSPWLMTRCGDDKDFWHPDLHEQAIFFSPGGEGSDGFVIVGMFSDARPLPSGAREGLYIKEFKDGARIEVDRENHVVSIKDFHGSFIKMIDGDIRIKSSGGKVRINSKAYD